MGYLSSKDVKRSVVLPDKESKELAELFGILTGDGYINIYRNNDYVIEIAGNKLLDKEYLIDYVKKLIKKLFNIFPNYVERKDQNTIYLRVLSKAIFNYLVNQGFKIGRKCSIDIPKWIKQDRTLMQNFVKGLFDTDGCISIKNKEGKKYPVLSITSISHQLLLSIKNYVNSLEVPSYITKEETTKPKYKHKLISYKLQINGYDNIILWFKLIGSNNERNLGKYRVLMKIKSKYK